VVSLKPDHTTAWMTAQPNCHSWPWQYVWLHDCVPAPSHMQQMSVIASCQKCLRRGSVRVRTPPLWSDRIRHMD